MTDDERDSGPTSWSVADFSSAAGLAPEAVADWVARQADVARRGIGDAPLRCRVAPCRREGFEAFECSFPIGAVDGPSTIVSVVVTGPAALGITDAGVQDAVSALELIGLLLAELDMPARIVLPPAPAVGAPGDQRLRSRAPAGRRHAADIPREPNTAAGDAATDLTGNISGLTDFCAATGLKHRAVHRWIQRQADAVRRRGETGRIRCGIAPYRREGFQFLACDFQSEEGDHYSVRVFAIGRGALYVSDAEVPDAASALALIGLLLRELDMPAWIDL